MDDDFCSIVNGIEEGRVLFDNLTKTIAVRCVALCCAYRRPLLLLLLQPPGSNYHVRAAAHQPAPHAMPRHTRMACCTACSTR